MKISLSKMPYDTSKNIFLDAHVKNLGRTARCRYLKTIGSIRKPLRKPKLTTQHHQKRMEWAKMNIKTAFENVLWTDECRATLDGPDGWAKGWILNGQKGKVLVRRQQGGGGVMFWAGIVGDELVGPFRVPDGLKMNSDSYCAFLEENLVPSLEEQNLRRRRSIVFQQDNAPSHASKYTTAWRESYGLTADRYMPWPANSPDLNPIENLWSIIKQKVYAGSRQFDSKEDLWDAIVSASQSVEPATIKALLPQLIQDLSSFYSQTEAIFENCLKARCMVCFIFCVNIFPDFFMLKNVLQIFIFVFKYNLIITYNI